MNSIVKVKGVSSRFLRRGMVTVTLTGEVNAAMAEAFAEQFDRAVASGQPFIPVLINSSGGDLYEAHHIIDRFSTAAVPVVTIVTGQAYSAAALIFSAGTEGYRYVSPHASIMLHDVGVEEVSGKCAEVIVETEELRRTNKRAYDLIAQNTGQEPPFFHDKVKTAGGADLYVDAQTALEWNLANHVGVPQLVTLVTVETQLLVGASIAAVGGQHLDVEAPTQSRKRAREEEEDEE